VSYLRLEVQTRGITMLATILCIHLLLQVRKFFSLSAPFVCAIDMVLVIITTTS